MAKRIQPFRIAITVARTHYHSGKIGLDITESDKWYPRTECYRNVGCRTPDHTINYHILRSPDNLLDYNPDNTDLDTAQLHTILLDRIALAPLIVVLVALPLEVEVVLAFSPPSSLLSEPILSQLSSI